MRKSNQNIAGSSIYRQLQKTRMSAHEREKALGAMRTAEAIVDAILWVKNKVTALGDTLLRPSLKASAPGRR